ncbi:phosphate ABC transporter permease subunit PstC [Marinisporobacter balticus]|uniref:Phosphate transport system permease protein n=1 Tax=Marinisporobacter balticus TaxID=2018667 RepID=A0A4R2KPA8_9FIRM|nr:phosphate ABC transporter permease subunit PstC [Marinisporobacter balticus]TCO72686.1 phosphate ABC transporter membrane protein 1 (PhoT family) [Marinisporobacter balticus]
MHKKFEKIFSNSIKGITFFSVMILICIIIFLIKESVVIFDEISLLDFIFGDKWNPVRNPPNISIFPMILGTLYVSFVAMTIALPIGVGAAIFLTSVVNEKMRKMIKPSIDLLAGIPSVIYGLIGLLVLVKFFEIHFDFSSGESVLVGGILLAIMVLPYIISTCDESMIKIAKRYKMASDGLGISKWHMIRYLILPASKKSILAGIILALARAMGETMAVMMVIGNSPIFPKLLGKTQTIPALIALEMGGAQVDSLHYHALFAAGLVLMGILFVVNMLFYYIKKNIDY